MVKTQTNTLELASRFVKSHALQKYSMLALALSHQTLQPLSLILGLEQGLWIGLQYTGLRLSGIQGHSKGKRMP